MKISVFGAGTWGTALAILLANNGHDVILRTSDAAKAAALAADRENIPNLPGARLNDTITVTDNLEEALKEPELIVFAVASPYVREMARKISAYVKDGLKIVNVSKGIEEKTLMTLTEIISEEIPNADVAVLSGPSHAEEVSRGNATTCVVGASTKKTAVFIQDVFMTEAFRVYTSPDIIGIELGGSLKNVIALAAGIADGLGCGDNAKAALITRGIVEISRLGVKMGGKAETFSGLSGTGDLIVTCASKHSRNRNAGYLIGKGYTMEAAMKEVNQVVEGVNSARAALLLAKKYEVDMPIVEKVNEVLFEGKTAITAMSELLLRDRTTESKSFEW